MLLKRWRPSFNLLRCDKDEDLARDLRGQSESFASQIQNTKQLSSLIYIIDSQLGDRAPANLMHRNQAHRGLLSVESIDNESCQTVAMDYILLAITARNWSGLHLQEAEERVRELEAVISKLVPGINLKSVLKSAQHVPQESSGTENPSLQTGSGNGIASGVESLPNEANGFDWMEHELTFDRLVDGMAALSVNPTGAGYLGLAVRTAVSLGLHKDFSAWQITPLQREMRRRVWWGLFIFDSGASITFGRPVLLPQPGLMDVSEVLNIDEESLTATSAAPSSEIEGPTVYTGLIAQSKFHLKTNSLHDRLISRPGPSIQEILELECEIDKCVDNDLALRCLSMLNQLCSPVFDAPIPEDVLLNPELFEGGFAPQSFDDFGLMEFGDWQGRGYQ
ncbi:putative Uncharacterized transcriptional regulatory protein C1F7.11c [Glarea lozoyensis 74030]|uniref:Putative Uncharacterized transcriptional regulatory protein C1F7.11c n=1 Tax=Glarea lozoyensis (strain ATCC 74030 / MF5533) TaxID=1104152 RepID=H0EJJ0_GLAL7|nr:putative Uncharacterized transcriptional regulatory protein C1F7.11c [Glarea lozoyensis 74030]